MPRKKEFAEARKCTNANEMKLERITIAVTIPIDKGAKIIGPVRGWSSENWILKKDFLNGSS